MTAEMPEYKLDVQTQSMQRAMVRVKESASTAQAVDGNVVLAGVAMCGLDTDLVSGYLNGYIHHLLSRGHADDPEEAKKMVTAHVHGLVMGWMWAWEASQILSSTENGASEDA